MSTEKPGPLYLVEYQGVVYEARYDPTPPTPGFVTRDGMFIAENEAQYARLAVVLDPEDEDVKALVRYVSHEPEVREIAFWTRVGDKIRAQITPPEHPPVAEVVNAVREWAQRFQPGDVWDPEDLRDLDSALWGTVEATPVRRTRKLENPREKPAKGPQSDAQGSGSGIGRVSESEASEGAPAHAEAWVGITISRKDRP